MHLCVLCVPVYNVRWERQLTTSTFPFFLLMHKSILSVFPFRFYDCSGEWGREMQKMLKCKCVHILHCILSLLLVLLLLLLLLQIVYGDHLLLYSAHLIACAVFNVVDERSERGREKARKKYYRIRMPTHRNLFSFVHASCQLILSLCCHLYVYRLHKQRSVNEPKAKQNEENEINAYGELFIPSCTFHRPHSRQ